MVKTKTKASPHQQYIDALKKKQDQLMDSYQRDKAAGNALPDDGIQDLADKAASAYSKELNNVRPQDTLLVEANSFINEGWSHFGSDMTERWMKTGQTVQKQTADWLKVAGFAYSLATGASREQAAIDKALAELAEGWSLERQAAVDRNILRLAAYEMLYEEKTPASVAINEAVELAKKYSAAESGRFVNGILGALALKLSGKAPVLEEDVAENMELEFDSEEPETLEGNV